jgi:hypothetical protein
MREEGMGFIRLQGPDRDVWRENYKFEFVVLASKTPEDWLTRCATRVILDVYHCLIGRHIHEVSDQWW